MASRSTPGSTQGAASEARKAGIGAFEAALSDGTQPLDSIVRQRAKLIGRLKLLEKFILLPFSLFKCFGAFLGSVVSPSGQSLSVTKLAIRCL